MSTVSTEVAAKEIKQAKPAVSERGGTVQHTEAEVDAALQLLVANGGELTRTAEQLKEQGLERISRQCLAKWRDVYFPRRYIRIRTEMGKEVAEKVAGAAMERAQQADEAEALYLEKAIEKINEVDANHLTRGVLSLAQAKAQNIEKAQLLRNLPTQNVKVDLGESIEVLERLKVLEPKDEVVDAEVVEET